MENIETNPNMKISAACFEPQNDTGCRLIDLMRKGLPFIKKTSVNHGFHDMIEREEGQPLELYQ